MDYQDKQLPCRDCLKTFVWTSGEQRFFEQKGFGAPSRCPECRKNKRQDAKKPLERSDKETFEITCSNCGQKGQVPFKPHGDQDVLCADCFTKSRS